MKRRNLFGSLLALSSLLVTPLATAIPKARRVSVRDYLSHEQRTALDRGEVVDATAAIRAASRDGHTVYFQAGRYAFPGAS